MPSRSVSRRRVTFSTKEGDKKSFLAKRYQHTDKPMHKLSPALQAVSVCATARRGVTSVPRGYLSRCPQKVMKMFEPEGIRTKEDYAAALAAVYSDFGLYGSPRRGMTRAFRTRSP